MVFKVDQRASERTSEAKSVKYTTEEQYVVWERKRRRREEAFWFYSGYFFRWGVASQPPACAKEPAQDTLWHTHGTCGNTKCVWLCGRTMRRLVHGSALAAFFVKRRGKQELFQLVRLPW